jgi:predicted histidine transporter YuiF (NhaC family)
MDLISLRMSSIVIGVVIGALVAIFYAYYKNKKKNR